MCWLCNPIRPSDGPGEFQLYNDDFAYKVGKTIYMAIEHKWPSYCRDFPAFSETHFDTRTATENDITVAEHAKIPVIFECYECGDEIGVIRGNEPPEKCKQCGLPCSYYNYCD